MLARKTEHVESQHQLTWKGGSAIAREPHNYSLKNALVNLCGLFP